MSLLQYIVKQTSFGDTEDYTRMLREFGLFYEEVISAIPFRIDKKQLELNDDIFINNDISKPNRTLSTQILNQISLKWFTINCDDPEIEAVSYDNYECDLVSKCISSQRIKLVMEIYRDYFLSEYVYCDQNKAKMYDKQDKTEPQFLDIFNHALRKYSAINLLNDFLHIHHVHILHHKQQKMYQNCKYGNKISSKCCDYYLHQNRQSKVTRKCEKGKVNVFDICFDALEYQERNVLELCSKIHTTINHRVFEDKNKPEKEKEVTDISKIRRLNFRSRIRNGNDIKFNKFINDVGVNEKDAKSHQKKPSIDGFYGLLIQQELEHNACLQFIRHLYSDEYDTDAVSNDVEDGYNNSNLYKILDGSKMHFNVINNYVNTLPEFRFGEYQFKYWPRYNKHSEYIAKPKYISLKQECLNNDIFHIDLQIFNQTLNKSWVYTNSIKGKSLSAADRGEDNNDHQIPVLLPLSVSHIFVVILYCNFSELQYHYKKDGCRAHYDDEPLIEQKKRNKEIGNWYKLLKECIKFYGSTATSSDTFYTGLKNRLSFESFAPLFNSPISTSLSWDVANGFADGKGVILQLQGIGKSNGDPYLDVEWISCYPDEQERLFFYAFELIIVDIHNYVGLEVVENKQYLRAFRLWSSLFAGHFVHAMLRRNKHRQTQQILRDLIYDYMNQIGINDDEKKQDETKKNVVIPNYMKQLFCHLIEKMRMNNQRINIVASEMQLLNASLQEVLISFDRNSHKIQLSPFLQSIIKNPENIDEMEEYLWVLSDKELLDLKQSKPDEWIESEIPMIYKMGGSDDNKITFTLSICRGLNGRKEAGYMINIKNHSVPADAYWSICMDDANWFTNGDDGLSTERDAVRLCFPDSKLNHMTSLTIKLAIFFYTENDTI